MKKSKVIALTNQKGGVGKTTTAVNLGIGLARQGKKVLLIDCDPQANLTMALGYERPDELEHTLSDIIKNVMQDRDFKTDDYIKSHKEGVDFIASNIELSGLEVQLVTTINREKILTNCIEPIKENYDYILIDCQPSLGIMTINALASANSVIIPSQSHYFSTKGLELLLQSVAKVKRYINPNLKIDGILMTMVMSRTNISKEINSIVKDVYGKQIKVFDTQIPYSIKAVESTAEGKSIYLFNKNISISKAYENFTKEVIELDKKEKYKNRAESVR